ncbi:class I SAM-dependent methyltransferase [bacterium]|nr:class I SAM-dependent methyltransferase [bacterium]MDC0322240.1 class I SAM-dependent methyltransferase [Verrucomicrobiales bacterium]
MKSEERLKTDMRRLRGLLKKVLADDEGARRALQSGDEARILDVACGACIEAETLSDVLAELKNGDAPVDVDSAGPAVKLTGIDVRAREIADAQLRFDKMKDGREFEFLTGDATKLEGHRELGEDFDVVFMRHQNYWNGQRTWEEIFDQGMKKLADNGRLVITSYFDKEHELALEAIQRLGGKLIVTEENAESRELSTVGKSIDRHIAVFEKKK